MIIKLQYLIKTRLREFEIRIFGMNNYKNIGKVRRWGKLSNKNIFNIIITRRSRYEAEFANKFVGSKFLPVGKPLNANFLLINTLHNSVALLMLLAFLTLFFLAPTINYAQTNNLLEDKTITGFVVNQNNEPWNNQIAELYEGDNLVATDTIRNGNFTFENINIVSVTNNEPFSTFTLSQNYPNPFNPSTIINYSVAKPQNISLIIYDILGQEVKTLFSGYSSQGNFSVSWNGFNNNGTGVSAGVYLYVLKNKSSQTVKKMILLDGNKSNIPTQNSANNSNNSYPKKILNKITEVYDYSIKIYGEDVITKVFSDFNFSNESPIDVGTLTAEAKPVLTGFVYDLDTKWSPGKWSEGRQRLTPNGINGMKAFLKSNPENYSEIVNGNFEIKLDSIPGNMIEIDSTYYGGLVPYRLEIKDTLVITGMNESDTTFYNFRTPIHKHVDIRNGFIVRTDNPITYGENTITAFNDTTGIPMIKRWTDLERGEDLLEHVKFVTGFQNNALGDPIWEGAVTRPRTQDFPLKVYMNRPIQPTSWYADSSLVGLKVTEVNGFEFVETTDSSSAFLVMTYIFNSTGQGWNIKTQEDELGRFKSYYEIRISGPPAGNPLLEGLVPYVTAHEALHIIFGGGNHSKNINDIFYASPTERFGQGLPNKSPEREKRMNKLVSDLERNCKLLDYSK